MTSQVSRRGAEDLRRLFAPASVAVVGALDDPARAGGRLAGYVSDYGYAGRIFFVNPARETIRGQPCHDSISAIGEAVDLALLSVRADRVPDALRDAGEAGTGAAVVFATGFAETGEEGRALQREVEEVAATYSMRVLGPNTAGVRSTVVNLFAEQGTNLATVGYRAGTVGIVSQSGALGGYFGSTYLSRQGAGTRYFVDTGNEVDVDVADCVRYMASDDAVSCIAIMLESCRDGRKLCDSVAAAHAASIPVLVLQVGRSDVGKRAARSHTDALASATELLEAELGSVGATVTHDELQLVDALVLHASGSVPSGPRLGVVTPSGGFGVLALDLAADNGLALPPVAALPVGDGEAEAALTNPLEVAALATSGPDRLEGALRHMSSQPNIDAVVLWHPHRLLLEEVQQVHLDALRASRLASGKPHYHCGLVPDGFRETLLQAGVVSIPTPGRLLRAIACVVPDASDRTATPPPQVDVGESDGASFVAPRVVRRWLDRIGLEVVQTEEISSAEEALRLQGIWGCPLFLKADTDEASHKTEHGLVVGPVVGEGVREAFERLARHPTVVADEGARIVAQPLESGIELALGAYHDPSFGPAVLVAHGGTYTEVMRDAVHAAAPVDRRRARTMIEHLRIFPALAGSRGTASDVDSVIDAIVSLSGAVAEVAVDDFSVDVNPLIVRREGKGAVAVDARIVVKSAVGSDEGETRWPWD